jgi:hypothetical protein
MLVAAVAALTLVVAGPALAASAAPLPSLLRADVPPLGLVALEQNGPFFDATIAAGDSQTFEVDRVNLNDAAVEARTYVGVVSTIVNGGFGAADSTAAVSGASTWVDYPAGLFTLEAQERNTAAFTVTVPADTAPGQYVSSIVLENAVAEAGTGTVALDRVVRQAVAISIRVPGELEPTFSLGRASLGLTAGNTVVYVATENGGNQHLKPEGTMTLADATGAVIHTTPITMGTFYAATPTTVAVALGSQLAPGDYTLSLELTDPPTGVSASLVDVPLSIAEPDLFDQATEFLAPITNLLPPGFTPLLIGLLIAGLLGLIAAIILGIRHLRRRRRARPATASAAEPTANSADNSGADAGADPVS